MQLTEGTGTTYNVSTLTATLPGGQKLALGSADNPDSFRGQYTDWAILDEPSLMAPRFFYEVLRPAMADRGAGLCAIGTPAGRHGLLYELWCLAEGDPDWSRAMYKASETGIIPQKELESARRLMDAPTFQQEFEVSWDAAIRGAFYNTEMARAEEEGRLTSVPHDHTTPVYVAFDLGVNDATACVFFQFDPGNRSAIRILESVEYTHTGLPDIVRELSDRPYHYGPWILPHDVNVTSLSTGVTRRETLENLGVDVVVAPKMDVIDGIEQTRLMLRRCWFDKTNAANAIEALRQYRQDYDPIRQTLRAGKPLHDWTSHVADAMRYLATTDHGLLSRTWGGTLDYSNRDRAMI